MHLCLIIQSWKVCLVVFSICFLKTYRSCAQHEYGLQRVSYSLFKLQNRSGTVFMEQLWIDSDARLHCQKKIGPLRSISHE